MKVTDVVSYNVLVDATRALCAELGVFVHVRPLPRHEATTRDGKTDGKALIWYALRAPLHVAAHEVAHIITPNDQPDHGLVWQDNFRRCARLLMHVM